MLDKSRVAMICILGMFAGFLVSRAALSVSMFLFGVNAIRDVPPRLWLKQKWWLLGLSWVGMYALSGLWSDDLHEWNDHVQVKLPFLLLPLAFAHQPRFSQRQMEVFTMSGALMLIVAACYSISIFLSDPQHYIQEYKVSHMLPTLPKKDHIRSSIASALFIAWCIYVWPRLQRRNIRWVVGICISLLIVYLHVLAAKSGLVSFYLFVVAWAIYLCFGKKKLLGLAILIAMPLAGMLAIRMIPTLKERANYIGFTIFMYKHGNETHNLGDVGRLVSYQLATDLIKAHPLTGVGAGDIKGEMDKLYMERYPNIDERSRLFPHNQFLTVAVGCGLFAMALFAIWVLWPLTKLRRNRQSFFFFIVWLILLVQLMIEPVLEVQFGVFVYVYFLLLFLQELTSPDEATPAATPKLG
ncbi:hypothetical protein GCM10023093_12730 [Nemorincola caseinilytica]|uniref:O-antigen ligase-related domain-containing protein n=1 Tax=Nemorincola caseinilytica TaxID=2054315 RepID=A0ABP8N9T2_9BACT